MERLAENYCEKKLNATVCVEAVQRYGEVVWEALINRTFDAYHACERFHLCEKTTHKEQLKAYVEEVMADKPATKIPTPTKKSTYTILQMTDPHIDLDYVEVKIVMGLIDIMRINKVLASDGKGIGSSPHSLGFESLRERSMSKILYTSGRCGEVHPIN